MIIQRDPGLWHFARFENGDGPVVSQSEVDAARAEAAGAGPVVVVQQRGTTNNTASFDRIASAVNSVNQALFRRGYTNSNLPSENVVANLYIDAIRDVLGPPPYNDAVAEMIERSVVTPTSYRQAYAAGDVVDLGEMEAEISEGAVNYWNQASKMFRGHMDANPDDDPDVEWERIVREVAPEQYEDAALRIARPNYTAEIAADPDATDALRSQVYEAAKIRFQDAAQLNPDANLDDLWATTVAAVTTNEGIRSALTAADADRPPTLAELRGTEDSVFPSNAAAEAHALLRQKVVDLARSDQVLTQADYDAIVGGLDQADQDALAQYWIVDEETGGYETNLDSGGPGGNPPFGSMIPPYDDLADGGPRTAWPQADTNAARVFTDPGGGRVGGGGGATLRDQATWLQAEIAAGRLTLDQAKFEFSKTIDERTQARADDRLALDQARQRLDRDEAFMDAGVTASRDRDTAFLQAARISLPFGTKYAPGFGPGESVGQLERFAGAEPSNVQTEVVPFSPGAIARTALNTFETRQGLA